jgi:hypothetical protein
MRERRGDPGLGPPEEWMQVPYGSLTLDEVFEVICAYAREGSAVSLGLTCRLFYRTLERLAIAAFASVTPRLLGRRGHEYLRARWGRFEACQEEVDAALLGATERGRAETACWLASADSLVPAPRRELLGESLTILVRQAISCEMMKVLVHACSVGARKQAFIVACAEGKLGIAQIAYRGVLEGKSERIALLKQGLATVGSSGCFRHIVTWAQSLIKTLERR